MQCTRAAYNYSIRKVKRDEDTLINERIADLIINNDFWSEIKRIWSNKARKSCIVDGQTEDMNIAKLFADKYRVVLVCRTKVRKCYAFNTRLRT